MQQEDPKLFISRVIARCDIQDKALISYNTNNDEEEFLHLVFKSHSTLDSVLKIAKDIRGKNFSAVLEIYPELQLNRYAVIYIQPLSVEKYVTRIEHNEPIPPNTLKIFDIEERNGKTIDILTIQIRLCDITANAYVLSRLL